MHPTRSIDLHREVLANRIGVGRALAAMVTIGLALVIIVSLTVAGAVRAGIAPDFDQQIMLHAQHVLVIHNGPSPTCASIPNPPQHDCFRPGPERREFSVDYLTANGVRSLVWFRLPTH
jgi:ABC-type lipoprotein release transport system permease subunit